jgi:hypothetical protein
MAELEEFEHNVMCPHCHSGLTLFSPMETIYVANRTYPNCHKDFTVKNSQAVAPPAKTSPARREHL